MIAWTEKDDVVVLLGLLLGNGMSIDCVCPDVQNVKHIPVNLDHNIVMWLFKHKFDLAALNCRLDVIRKWANPYLFESRIVILVRSDGDCDRSIVIEIGQRTLVA